ncbi:MAG: hypothetical protein JNK43_06655 [Ignavibacteria bacterium]|nr:hypothetical protein [Ignavibacteria bacterium]
MSAHSFHIKERYFIEPGYGISGWVMRKEGSGSVVKKAKHRNMLLYFAEKTLFRKNAELSICDSNGMIEDIIDFSRTFSY